MLAATPAPTAGDGLHLVLSVLNTRDQSTALSSHCERDEFHRCQSPRQELRGASRSPLLKPGVEGQWARIYPAHHYSEGWCGMTGLMSTTQYHLRNSLKKKL